MTRPARPLTLKVCPPAALQPEEVIRRLACATEILLAGRARRLAAQAKEQGIPTIAANEEIDPHSRSLKTT